ncbi:hypothetical protein JOS77_08385 [Chromobacterium haemolyticum]|nr:hypothetical protein JOS77_08385 [Chromobacterium haemolyticum]
MEQNKVSNVTIYEVTTAAFKHTINSACSNIIMPQHHSQIVPAIAISSTATKLQDDNLASFKINKQFEVSLQFDGIMTIALIIFLIIILGCRYWFFRTGKTRDFELNEAEFGLGQQNQTKSK